MIQEPSCSQDFKNSEVMSQSLPTTTHPFLKKSVFNLLFIIWMFYSELLLQVLYEWGSSFKNNFAMGYKLNTTNQPLTKITINIV